MKRVAAGMVLAMLAGTFGAPGTRARAVAGPPNSIHASTTAHGLQLTLTVPRRAYPRNALARVAVRFKNDTRHPLGLTAACVGYPDVEVSGGPGQVLYPPALLEIITPLGCLPKLLRVLAPGRTFTVHTLIIVRAPTVRAIAFLRPVTTQSIAPVIAVHTPHLRLTLTSEPPPTVSLDPQGQPPTVLGLDVVPTQSMAGALHYIYEVGCFSGGGVSEEGSGFTVTAGTHLTLAPVFTAACDRVEWHIVLGWLNHAVATLDYPAVSPPSELGLTLGAPLAPAHLTQEKAEALARAYDTEIGLVPSSAYGSLDAHSMMHDGKPIGLVDVWEVTVSNVNIPAPGPRGRSHPIYHHLTVVVDDKGEYVLFATAY